MKIYNLEVTLVDTTVIKRTIEITENYSLDTLARSILISFNFSNIHEYFFKINDKEYIQNIKSMEILRIKRLYSINEKLEDILENCEMNTFDFQFYYDMACFWTFIIKIKKISQTHDKRIKLLKMLGDYLPEDTGSTEEMHLLVKRFSKSREDLFNYKKIDVREINEKLLNLALM